MVKINVVRIIEEEWSHEDMADRAHLRGGERAAFERIAITGTTIENLQYARITFTFPSHSGLTCWADLNTNENVWSCDFEFGGIEYDETEPGEPDVIEGADVEDLGAALLNIGEHVMGMYS